MSTKEIIDKLYNDVAEHFGITVKELMHRLVSGNETLVHQYYTEKFPGGF